MILLLVYLFLLPGSNQPSHRGEAIIELTFYCPDIIIKVSQLFVLFLINEPIICSRVGDSITISGVLNGTTRRLGIGSDVLIVVITKGVEIIHGIEPLVNNFC